MERIKRIVAIENFEKPQNCWECPILKERMGELFCGLIGERKGKIRTYDRDYIHEDCKLVTFAYKEKEIEVDVP